MSVEICRHPRAWDDYVLCAPEATICHRWAWRDVIEHTFGHEGFYLAARDGENKIRGIFPLVFVKSTLFGNALISVPFLTYGGVLTEEFAVQAELLGAAVQLARELGAKRIEMRQGEPRDLGWQHVSTKVDMRVRLPGSNEEMWSSLSSRLRNKVRQARKHGLRVQWSGAEGIDDFYNVFACNMRNLGTPVYPRAWFVNLFRELPADARILSLWEQGQAVAATVITTFRDTVELPWIASLPEWRSKYSTVLLYWSALEWASQNGYRYVDLGRCTRGSGTYDFKRHWNCEEVPLHWYYWTASGEPALQLRPDNPKFRWAIRAWQHLPMSIANTLGPLISRSLP